MSEHAVFSPSKMQRIMTCPGSLALESLAPDRSNRYAAEGTAAHELLELCILDGRYYAAAYEGRIFKVEEADQTFEFEADEEMCGYIQDVLDQIKAMVEAAEAYGWTVEVHAERRINTSGIVGIDGQFGTADVILVMTKGGKTRLVVGDLKYGKGVAVYAVEDGVFNVQLMNYAGGVYDLFSALDDIELITLAIFMPRQNYTSTVDVTPQDIEAFRVEATKAARLADKQAKAFEVDCNPAVLTLNPDTKACQFCKAKANCPALAGKVQDVVGDFESLPSATDGVKKAPIDLYELSWFMDHTDLIEDWCNAVRARIEAELFTGESVPGYKLVEGRKGHRKWTDKAEAENIMKSMRLKQEAMYTMNLISPAQAEKVLKDSEKRWKRLAPLIEQNPGKPSVVPESDKRPALVLPSVADEFTDLDAAGDVL